MTLRDLAAGHAEALVVAKLDRLSRSVLDFAAMMETAMTEQRQTRPHCQKAARAGGVYLAGQIGLVGQSLAQHTVLLLEGTDLAVEVSDQEGEGFELAHAAATVTVPPLATVIL